MQITLETDRLILRKMTIDDAGHLFEFFSDTETTKYLPGTKDLNEITEWLHLVFESYRRMNFGPWALILKESNQFLGYCGLYLQNNVDGKDEIELLYGLIKQYWGEGFATEAAFKVHNYGVSKLGLKRFVSLIAPGNQRSLNVAKSLGMGFEKECILWNTRYHMYSIE